MPVLHPGYWGRRLAVTARKAVECKTVWDGSPFPWGGFRYPARFPGCIVLRFEIVIVNGYANGPLAGKVFSADGIGTVLKTVHIPVNHLHGFPRKTHDALHISL